VLVAVGILIWGLAWLKDYSFQRSTRTWRVEFAQSGGLASSDEVQVNGMRKGEVKSMKLVQDQVLIELNLDKSIVITHDSRVSIRSLGMMGEKIIAVDLKSTGGAYREDEVIPGVYEKGMDEVMGDIGGTIQSITLLARQLEATASVLNHNDRLSKTVDNFSRTSEQLSLAVSENRATLREVLVNLASASRSAKSITTDREEQIKRTIDHFSVAAENMEHLSVRLDSLRMTIQNVSGKLDRGEGTLGKLVQDEKLYTDLSQSVKTLNELIADIKAHPRRYFKFSVF
jgi:phospholipid/cholesterol/gamma-HCH transport system substrate-binding protein